MMAATDCKEKTPTAGDEVIRHAQEVLELSAYIANKTPNKLATLMVDPMPSNCSASETVRSLPEYFNEMRSMLWQIKHNLEEIGTCIDRVDI